MRALVIVSSLWGALAAGCDHARVPATADANPVDGAGDASVLDPDVDAEPARPACNPDVDADPATNDRAFTIEHLRVPVSNTIGVNLDGITSTNNQDLAGCRKIDGAPGGIDDALAEIFGADGLGDLFGMAGLDINVGLQRAVDSGATELTIKLTSWNGTASDACVGVEISGSSEGAPIDTLSGGGALVDGEIDLIVLSGSLRIVASLALSPSGGLGTCTMDCIDAILPITISGVHARIVFDPVMGAIVVGPTPDNTSSTILAGHVRFTGTDAAAFQPGLDALSTRINPDLAKTVDAIVSSYLDLDSTPGPGLSACTSTGGSAVSADTFSAAILVDAVQGGR